MRDADVATPARCQRSRQLHTADAVTRPAFLVGPSGCLLNGAWSWSNRTAYCSPTQGSKAISRFVQRIWPRSQRTCRAVPVGIFASWLTRILLHSVRQHFIGPHRILGTDSATGCSQARNCSLLYEISPPAPCWGRDGKLLVPPDGIPDRDLPIGSSMSRYL